MINQLYKSNLNFMLFPFFRSMVCTTLVATLLISCTTDPVTNQPTNQQNTQTEALWKVANVDDVIGEIEAKSKNNTVAVLVWQNGIEESIKGYQATVQAINKSNLVPAQIISICFTDELKPNNLFKRLGWSSPIYVLSQADLQEFKETMSPFVVQTPAVILACNSKQQFEYWPLADPEKVKDLVAKLDRIE
jgi:hypothetical protein